MHHVTMAARSVTARVDHEILHGRLSGYVNFLDGKRNAALLDVVSGRVTVHLGKQIR